MVWIFFEKYCFHVFCEKHCYSKHWILCFPAYKMWFLINEFYMLIISKRNLILKEAQTNHLKHMYGWYKWTGNFRNWCESWLVLMYVVLQIWCKYYNNHRKRKSCRMSLVMCHRQAKTCYFATCCTNFVSHRWLWELFTNNIIK